MMDLTLEERYALDTLALPKVGFYVDNLNIEDTIRFKYFTKSLLVAIGPNIITRTEGDLGWSDIIKTNFHEDLHFSKLSPDSGIQSE